MFDTLRLSRTAWILIFSRSAGSTVKVNLSFGMTGQYAYTCYRVNSVPAHFLHVLSQSLCPSGLVARPLGVGNPMHHTSVMGMPYWISKCRRFHWYNRASYCP